MSVPEVSRRACPTTAFPAQRWLRGPGILLGPLCCAVLRLTAATDLDAARDPADRREVAARHFEEPSGALRPAARRRDLQERVYRANPALQTDPQRRSRYDPGQPCTFSLTPTSRTHSGTSETGTVSVTALAGCASRLSRHGDKGT